MNLTIKKNIIIEIIMSFFVVLFLLINLLCPYVYKSYIMKYSKIYALDSGLVGAIIFVESKFDKNAKSNKNAIGLMQLMSSTAESFYNGDSEEFNEKFLYDAEMNIEIGCRYLRYLFNKYYDEVTVLACYNAGEKNVLEWMGDSMYLEKTQIRFKETRKYIEKVQNMKKIYEKLLI